MRCPSRSEKRFAGAGKLGIIALATLTGACAGTAAPRPGTDRELIAQENLPERLDRFLARAANSGFNGSVLVAQDDRIILHRGYGWADRSRTESVTTSTPFWIASISKQFTAAAILSLAEEGRLSVQDSITRFLSVVPVDKRGITIHLLLTHSAGLEQRYAADGMTERDAAVRALLGGPLAHLPGQGFGYSNDAYNLLAVIVEMAAGVPFEDYIRERLLRPAGLTTTGFWGPLGHPEVAAILGDGPSVPSVAGPNWGFRGGTGMFSTAGDLYRWYQALSERRILSEPSLQRLLMPHRTTAGGTGVGYGWFVSKTPRRTISLWTRGYESFGHGAVLATYPEERTVIIVTSNSGEQRPGLPVCHKLAEDLAGMLFGSSPTPARGSND